jgi:preprotein translocase SecY subunit
MFRKIALIVKDRELLNKVLQVIGLVIIARFLTHIPIPGLEVKDLNNLIDNNTVLSLLNVISGGGYGALSFVMLGITPYITASIVFQLLGVIVPKIAEIKKEEGERGQQKINRWTRYATIPLAALSAWGILRYLSVQGQQQGGVQILPQSFIDGGFNSWSTAIISLTCGSIIIMWIGEIINEYKLGNGISLMILAGILTKLPANIASQFKDLGSQFGLFFTKLREHPDYVFNGKAWSNFWTNANGQFFDLKNFILIVISFLVVLVLVVFMNDAVRKILIVYSRRGHSEGSSRTLDSVKADLPLKVNVAGVVPIIFAVSFVLFPSVIATFLQGSNLPQVTETANNVEKYLSSDPNTVDGTKNGQRVIEPESIRSGWSWSHYYATSDKQVHLDSVNYDPTRGGDFLGFNLNNFKGVNCKPADDASQLDKDLANVASSHVFGIKLPCEFKIAFLPDAGYHFSGLSAYYTLYFLLIVFFTYFYTSNVIFKTDDVAENLQKSGAYIPGYKPGAETEKYLGKVANRLNVVGSIFLALIALIPILLSRFILIDQGSGLGSVVGGTTILILVSVALDTLRQIDAQITSADYNQFVK